MEVARAYEQLKEACRRIAESSPYESVRAAALGVMLGVPASFITQGIEPVQLDDSLYVLEIPTRRKRVYKVYLFADELPLYRKAVRAFSGTERLLQYHMRKVFNSISPNLKLTWKDVQALKLTARKRGDLVTEYDVRRLAVVVEALLSTQLVVA